jgi:ubiquinone/menaquinone biosynthesis C-methylase UbiE
MLPYLSDGEGRGDLNVMIDIKGSDELQKLGLQSQSVAVYEEIGLREVGEGLIRPGGFLLTQRAVILAGLTRGSRVLDVGCGTGAALRGLEGRCGFSVVGVDPSEVLLSETQKEGERLPVIRALGERLPFTGAVFDAVLAECSLSVTVNLDGVLRECARVLNAGGKLLVSDVYARNPDGAAEVRGLPIECCLTGAVSKEDWISQVEAGGFEVMLWEDHSQALKEFAARLILSYGSMDAFWDRFRKNAQKDAIEETQCAVSKARPGYFLLIARRR